LGIGIWLSASRAAIIGAIIILTWWGWQSLPQKFTSKKILFSGMLIGICSLFYIGTQTDIMNRAGTSEHFTRPIAAFSVGTKHLLKGHIGQWGPAARAKNLATQNSDKAPIAENVLADWWVQLGILGFVLGLGWLISVIVGISTTGFGFGLATIILINLATVFDMTPIAITWGTILAMWQKEK
jgi:hypothetical protein